MSDAELLREVLERACRMLVTAIDRELAPARVAGKSVDDKTSFGSKQAHTATMPQVLDAASRATGAYTGGIAA